MVFKRARTEEQKNIRRDQIIEATIKLLEKRPLEKITLASIASELNFSRANLYKYVTTRDEIFLWIVASDAEKWIKGLQKSLENYEHLDLKTFCRIWAEQIYENKRLIKLFSLLSIVLENSSTLDAFEKFKQNFYESFSQVKVIIQRLLPDLSNENFKYFINYQMYYALGQFSSIVPNEQQQTLKASKSSRYKRDFVSEFTEYLEVIIIGLREVENNPR